MTGIEPVRTLYHNRALNQTEWYLGSTIEGLPLCCYGWLEKCSRIENIEPSSVWSDISTYVGIADKKSPRLGGLLVLLV